MPQIWPKRCSCGADYTETTWKDLQLVSPSWPESEARGSEAALELRNCGRCGSTIAVVATRPEQR